MLTPSDIYKSQSSLPRHTRGGRGSSHPQSTSDIRDPEIFGRLDKACAADPIKPKNWSRRVSECCGAGMTGISRCKACGFKATAKGKS